MASIVPSAQPLAQRVAVAQAAQRRAQVAVACRSSRGRTRTGGRDARPRRRSRQALLPLPAAPWPAPRAVDSRHRCRRTPVSRASSSSVETATVSAQDRDRRQTEPRRHLAVVRDAALGEAAVLRAQPDREAEGRGILQRSHAARWVSLIGASACEKATQPASVSSAISVSAAPFRPMVSAPSG